MNAMKFAHFRCCSLAIPALVGFALLALVPLGFAADKPAEAKPILSDAQFKKITDAIDARGTTYDLSSNEVMKALGATRKGEALMVRIRGYREKGSDILHSIARLPNDAGYVVTLAGKGYAYNFRVDKNRELIAAVHFTKEDGIVVVPNKEAQEKLNVEWRYWAETGDQL